MRIVVEVSDGGVDRRKVLIGLLFGSSAAVAAWRKPSNHIDFLGKQKLEEQIPKTAGRWKFVSTSGLVVPPEDQLSQALYSQLLTRIYWNGEAAVMLLIAHSSGQTGILQVHRPEVCYPASGFQLSAVESQEVRLGGRLVPTNRLTASAEGQDEHILYFTRVGTDLPADWRSQRLSVAEQNLRGIIPDAVLFRASIRSNDRMSAFRILEEFVRSMIAAMSEAQRRILIG